MAKSKKRTVKRKTRVRTRKKISKKQPTVSQAMSGRKGKRRTLAIIGLLLNILILPGLGSLIGGRTRAGVWQFVLLFGSVILGLLLTVTVIGALIGVPLMFLGPLAAWLWGLITGIQMVQNS